jgi:hypothetical protein
MTYDRSPEFDQEAEMQVMSPAPESDALTQITRGEIDVQIATAKKWPRDLKLVRKNAIDMVTADEQTADECIYALPRAGKTIEGPSARFAEILAYTWGNNRSGARPVAEDEEFVTAQGVYFDLQANVAVTYEVKRRITDSKGRRYNADMVGTTTNAANSIARRNAILGGIPKSLWLPIYNAARQVVAGDVRTLANRRGEAVKAFAKFGIKPEQIFALLEITAIEDMTGEHLVTLRGVLTAIREGDLTPEAAFAPKQDVNLASKSAANLQEIKDRYSPKPEAAGEPPAPSGPPEASVTAQAAATTEAPPAPAALQQEEVVPLDVVSLCHKHGQYPGEGNCPKCEEDELAVLAQDDQPEDQPDMFDAQAAIEQQQQGARGGRRPAAQRRPHRDDG